MSHTGDTVEIYACHRDQLCMYLVRKRQKKTVSFQVDVVQAK